MLIYVKQDGDIYNLDNMVRIYPEDDIVCFNMVSGGRGIMVRCENEEQAKNVVSYIYHRMTLGNGNVVLDLDDFEEG